MKFLLLLCDVGQTVGKHFLQNDCKGLLLYLLEYTIYGSRYAAEISSPYLTHVFAIDDHGDGESYNVTSKMFPNNQTQKPEFDPKELEDVCELLLSSGTTGPPKAVKFTHRDVYRFSTKVGAVWNEDQYSGFWLIL